jgi:hypothetical protein
MQKLSDVGDELIKLCQWLKDRGDIETASRLIVIMDQLRGAYEGKSITMMVGLPFFITSNLIRVSGFLDCTHASNSWVDCIV